MDKRTKPGLEDIAHAFGVSKTVGYIPSHQQGRGKGFAQPSAQQVQDVTIPTRLVPGSTL